eukprot:scaffold8149_cov130-Skeletonema_dohrnii-CCMP3373.AAC.1
MPSECKVPAAAVEADISNSNAIEEVTIDVAQQQIDNAQQMNHPTDVTQHQLGEEEEHQNESKNDNDEQQSQIVTTMMPAAQSNNNQQSSTTQQEEQCRVLLPDDEDPTITR